MEEYFEFATEPVASGGLGFKVWVLQELVDTGSVLLVQSKHLHHKFDFFTADRDGCLCVLHLEPHVLHDRCHGLILGSEGSERPAQTNKTVPGSDAPELR